MNRFAVLVPAVIVGVAAVAATAHGGYEVAVACKVPEGLISGLYPAITDGLALVAYAATHRLRGAGRSYAWLVVVLAAALSGLAQASYLASGPALETSAALRFGVGAWPAVAGAIAAHLVYLIAVDQPAAAEEKTSTQPVPFVVLEDETATIPSGPVPAELAETIAETMQKGRALRLAPNLTPTPPRGIPVVPPVGEDEVAKAARLLAEGVGRPTLMNELDLKDHQARALMKDPDRAGELLARYRAREAARA